MSKKTIIILLIIIGGGVCGLSGIILLPAAILCSSGPKFINEGYDIERKTDEIYVDTMCIFRRRIHLTQDIEGDAWESSAKWSPNREKIVFIATDDEHNEYNIFVIDVNGEGLVQLTNRQGQNDFPNWSSDGKQIVFQSDRDGNEEIYVMNSDGSNQVNLTQHDADDLFPYWAPKNIRTVFREKAEEDYITFTSDRDGNLEVYVMNVNTGTLLNLTNDPDRNDYSGEWLADGRILFSSAPLNSLDNISIFVNVDGSQEILEGRLLDPDLIQ